MNGQMPDAVREANRRLYDLVGGLYEDIDGRRGPALRAWLRATLADLRRRSPGGRLLDIGAGAGLVGRCAEGIFQDRVGLDISRRVLDAAAPAYESTVVGDAERLPFADASFDVVTAFATLHHIPDHACLAAEVARVLRPGGVFYSDHDMDRAFFERFRPLLLAYRRLRDATGDWRRAGGDEAARLHEVAEHHASGVDTAGIARLLAARGLSVESRFHWFGLSRATDVLFGARAFPRGLAPLGSLLAQRPAQGGPA